MLKKLFFFLTLCVILIACSSQQPVAPSVNSLVGQIQSKTVALYDIEFADDAYKISSRPLCAGVWVGWHLILTAAHCTEDVDLVYTTAEEYSGVEVQPKSLHFMRLVKVDPMRDLALYQTGIDTPFHMSAVLAEREAFVGDDLLFMGHVKGFAWTFKRGWVSQYRESTFKPTFTDNRTMLGPWMQVSAPIWQGDSGSAAWNTQGEIVGIASFGTAIGANVAFFVPLESIRQFLK